MTSQLPMFEVIATARQKLSGVSACLNDSQKFSSSLLEFDLWLSEHIQAFSEIKQVDLSIRTKLKNSYR